MIQKCFHSPSAARKPKCRKFEGEWCQSCLEALAIYENIKASKKLARRKKNRASAALSKWKKEERFSDLCAENIALNAQHDELVQELETIDGANNALSEAMANKLQILAALMPNQNF